MRASDVMTTRVVTIAPSANVREAVDAMLEHRISGLPVVDSQGDLVGIVTEGDFLRRVETGTVRKRPRWLQILLGPNSLAVDYIRSHGHKVEDVMSRDPVCVEEDAELDAIVAVMERKRVKRVPVVRGRKVVGIVSRSNLLRAFASVARDAPPAAPGDAEIKRRVLEAFEAEPWAPVALVDIVVKDGVVDLWGSITEPSQGDALKVCAEGIPGVKRVVGHLAWIEPMSGLVVTDERSDSNGPGR